MGKALLHCNLKFLCIRVSPKDKRKTAIFAQVNPFRNVVHSGTSVNDCLTSRLALSKGLTSHTDTEMVFIRLRVRLHHRKIGLQPFDLFLPVPDSLGEKLNTPIFQHITLALMVCFLPKMYPKGIFA